MKALILQLSNTIPTTTTATTTTTTSSVTATAATTAAATATYLSGVMGNQRLTIFIYRDYIGIPLPQKVKGYLLY